MELNSLIKKLNVDKFGSLFWLLLPCFLVFCIFAFLGYCSFPVSDDFIMAQDTRKGFFWAMLYWLGFWFSGWFILALQLSIPLVYGFWDYGLPFYLFIYLWLFSACFFLVKSFSKSNKLAALVASVFATFYIIFNTSPSETIFWNIGALSYTGSISTMMYCMAVYFYARENILVYKNKVDIYLIFGLFISLISVYFLVFGSIKNLTSFLDDIFPFRILYLLWIGLILFLCLLIKLSSKFYYSNFLLLFLFIFFSVGFGPHISFYLVVFFVGTFLAFFLGKKEISYLSVFGFFSVVLLTIFMLLLPGTKSRIGLTHADISKDFYFFKEGIKYLFTNQFFDNHLYIGYGIIFFLGRFLSFKFFKEKLFFKYSRFLFIPSVVFVFLFSLVLYYGANGHFPSRLISNFAGIYFLLFLFFGLSSPMHFRLPFQVFLLASGFFLTILISPNFHSALEDIFYRDALGFRQNKISLLMEIQSCKTDTCEVDYKNFKLVNIPDQDFIFPGESGFVLSHKLVISKYFGKKCIRYNPSSLPPGLRK